MKVSKILSDVIRNTDKTSSKIGVFRYWLTMTNSCDGILHMVKSLIPLENEHVDEYLIDELNRAGMLALQSNTDECGDYSIIQIVKDLISGKYPETAQNLYNTFL